MMGDGSLYHRPLVWVFLRLGVLDNGNLGHILDSTYIVFIGTDGSGLGKDISASLNRNVTLDESSDSVRLHNNRPVGFTACRVQFVGDNNLTTCDTSNHTACHC